MWELFRHPIVFIAPTLGALVGASLGYYATLRARWATASALLVAFIIAGSLITPWFYGATALEYGREVLAAMFTLVLPTLPPFLMAVVASASNMKRPGTLLTAQVVVGLLGVLAYPVWAILCACWVAHDCL